MVRCDEWAAAMRTDFKSPPAPLTSAKTCSISSLVFSILSLSLKTFCNSSTSSVPDLSLSMIVKMKSTTCVWGLGFQDDGRDGIILGQAPLRLGHSLSCVHHVHVHVRVRL